MLGKRIHVGKSLKHADGMIKKVFNISCIIGGRINGLLFRCVKTR